MDIQPVQILRKYWNHQEFRPLQEEIIQSVLSGKDTFALLPTGGGKSVCFQIPALLLEGTCVVITPLIALMKDQVEQLQSKGIPAAFIDSGMHRKEIERILDNSANGAYKFLYISPERIKTGAFYECAKRMKISLLAVDEAHCISQWGYDFRPAYLGIFLLRDMAPGITIIALTATATPEVKNDIIEKLQLISPSIFQKSFARANLSYSCFNEEDKQKKILNVLQNVPGSSIIYVRSRMKAKIVSDFLVKNKISADYYHAGLTYQQRIAKQDNWIKTKSRVMVSTNAFGMGIDKPDVRTVIHIDIPESIEAYYQEAGRAGRDEKKAYAISVFSRNDIVEMQERLKEQYPEVDQIRKVYQALANFLQIATGNDETYYDFDILQFHKKFAFESKMVFFSLKHLEQQGFVLFNESFYAPSKIFVPDHTSLYKFQVENSKFDPFIKAVLRIYGGEVYNDFIKISESYLASKINISKEAVISLLAGLDKASVLIYQPQKDKPQVAFMKERYEASKLPFDTNNYKTRKDGALKKITAMTGYLTADTRCRTLLLTDYFEEFSDSECGICDNCLKKKRKHKNFDDEIKLYKKLISEALAVKAFSPEDLSASIKPKYKEVFVRSIQELIEVGILKYDERGTLVKN